MPDNHILVVQDQTLHYLGKTYPCAIGKGGISPNKQEGDGASPIGVFALKEVFYRADRLKAPETSLPLRAISDRDGWCDDPSSPEYNRLVQLPFTPSHEVLKREDHIYDIIVVLGHNDNPPIPGKGSAIFFHLARENYLPTEGCIAVSLEDMFEILKNLPTNGGFMDIRPSKDG